MLFPLPLSPLHSLLSKLVGPGRLELPASALSGLRSSQLSYGPGWLKRTGRPHAAGTGPTGNQYRPPESADSSTSERRLEATSEASSALWGRRPGGSVETRASSPQAGRYSFQFLLCVNRDVKERRAALRIGR